MKRLSRDISRCLGEGLESECPEKYRCARFMAMKDDLPIYPVSYVADLRDEDGTCRYQIEVDLPKTAQQETQMRTLDEHKVNPANDTLTISVVDEPGAGGANHAYRINWAADSGVLHQVSVDFQNGPINEAGVNGVTHEALLAIVADRLRSFQKGPYTCKANACALTHIEEAQHWLQQRTIERMRRGIEGTHAV